MTIDPTNEAAYAIDQRRPHWPATIAGFEAASAEVAHHPRFTGDIGFGDRPRERFDRFAAEGEARGLLVYFHPGYWQMRDRTLFRCLMPIFAGLGLDVATVGYPLCPEVSMAELIRSACASLPAVRAHGRAARGCDLPVIAAGHSAGAHLAVELTLAANAGPGGPIAGVVAISGVYDLEPLIATSLNAALGLDRATARAASPIHRVGAQAAPALFAVGAAETEAFLEQNRRMAAAWRAAGHRATEFESPGDDHFSVIERLREPASPLWRAVTALIDDALAAPTGAA
ncbi:MAG: alpha/beta hydrolase [Siculibacillus sp.]|nr:alpha/beta hydrolase [Siculibacillus sp.]